VRACAAHGREGGEGGRDGRREKKAGEREQEGGGPREAKGEKWRKGMWTESECVRVSRKQGEYADGIISLGETSGARVLHATSASSARLEGEACIRYKI
jgi:hypothetical protein